ncbi:hypothetical protein ACSBR1_039969 [Camellia fascicularis]
MIQSVKRWSSGSLFPRAPPYHIWFTDKEEENKIYPFEDGLSHKRYMYIYNISFRRSACCPLLA